MGSIQAIHSHLKNYQAPSSTKSIENPKQKRIYRFRTTMRNITLRALTTRNSHNSVSSSNNSSTNHSAFLSPDTTATMNSTSLDMDSYLSDFDYQKLATLTGLSESKISDLHREFLILSYNGQLSYERYKAMLEAVPMQQTPEQLDRLARQTFLLFDKDGNNYLDFAEFIAAYIKMEKNELGFSSKTQTKDSSKLSVHPAITTLTQHATIYRTPPKTLTSASPIVSHRTTYFPTNYTSTDYPRSSEQYVYIYPQYTLQRRERT